MRQNQIHEILDRLINDEIFRRDFEKDREPVLKRYRLTKRQIRALRVVSLSAITGALVEIATGLQPGHF